MLLPLSKFTVAVPGTLVRLSSTQPSPSQKFAIHGILVQALPANTGKVYIGSATMNRTAMTQVIATLAIPTDNTIPSFTAALTLSPNALNLSDFYIDADMASDGVTVSVLVN